MPKLKTHKGTARRFRLSGSGKLMRTKGMHSHFRRKRADRAKRMYAEMMLASPGDASRVKKLIPYGVR